MANIAGSGRARQSYRNILSEFFQAQIIFKNNI